MVIIRSQTVCILPRPYILQSRDIFDAGGLSRKSDQSRVVRFCKCRLLTARSAIRDDVHARGLFGLRFLLSRSARVVLRNWQWTLRRRCSHVIGSFGELETMKFQRADGRKTTTTSAKNEWTTTRKARRNNCAKIFLRLPHLLQCQAQVDATLALRQWSRKLT